MGSVPSRLSWQPLLEMLTIVHRQLASILQNHNSSEGNRLTIIAIYPAGLSHYIVPSELTDITENQQNAAITPAWTAL